MARYKLIEDENSNATGVIVNDETHPNLPQGACIPANIDNADWQEYLTWEESNDADAADNIDYMQMMRDRRNTLLTACDWTQLSDSPLSAAKKTEYQTYRQDLRDMPQDNPNVDTKAEYDALVWPTEPNLTSSSSAS